MLPSPINRQGAAPFFSQTKYSFYKDFYPDRDQDTSAEDRRFPGQPCARLSADHEPSHADCESNCRNDQTGRIRHNKIIFRDRKAYRERVNGSRDPLNEKILGIIQATGVNIEYVYAFTSAVAGSAYVVLRVNDIEEAEAVLARNGIETLSDGDLAGLL